MAADQEHEKGTPLWTSFTDGSTSVVKAKS